MTALDHVNGEQLKMFMSAREIVENFHPLDLHDEHPSELWHRKMDQARQYGENEKHESMAHSIVAEGVKSPVSLVHRDTHGKALAGGHHRTAVMLYHDADAPTIPVIHHERLADVMQPPMQRYYRYT